jgi:hypothetical protein
VTGYDQLAADLAHFHRALVAFTVDLRAGLQEVERHHTRVDPVWRDRFRRNYDQRHDELADPVHHYAERDAEAFERFVGLQLRALRRYLDG